MIKKSLIVTSLLLAGTSVMAQNYFIGADYGNYKASATMTYTSGVNSISETNSDRDKNIGFKVGIDNIANGRTYISYGNKYNESALKYRSIALNYDYYIGKYNKFTPFIGASIGQGKLSWDIDGISASGTGIEYGIKFGTFIEITENINFETGYTYGKSNADATATNPNNSSESIKIKADKMQGLYIGFNYKF